MSVSTRFFGCSASERDKMPMSERSMTETSLQADVEAAKEALAAAESDLQAALEEITAAPRAAKAKASDGVSRALAGLCAARSKLAGAQELWALRRRTAAMAAVADAETYLDQVVDEMSVVASTRTTWTTKVVEDAFVKLRAAKATLAGLELDETGED